jgi:hypothetical protein
VSGLAPVNALELRHVGGQTAAWHFNPDFSVKTNVLEHLPDAERGEFVDATMRCFGEAWPELVAVPNPALDDETRSHLQLVGHGHACIASLQGGWGPRRMAVHGHWDMRHRFVNVPHTSVQSNQLTFSLGVRLDLLGAQCIDVFADGQQVGV